MNDVSELIDTIRQRELFARGAPIVVARAPGRLDVMGGIADYSGSLVLQRPIAEATFVAVQLIERPAFEFVSLGREPFTLPFDQLGSVDDPVAYSQLRSALSHSPNHWVSYVAGVFLTLLRERRISFPCGARVVISSAVPEGKGVSSSAALETAVMQAAVNAFGIPLAPRDMALLCQMAENHVAGAPCGVMDQMTCVFGEKDSLLALLCQPAELQAPVAIPSDIALWGIDSGERHAVSGSDYTSVRTGAFMGFRLITENASTWNRYLANISPEQFEQEFLDLLPEEMAGDEFLERHGRIHDFVTTVDPARTYKIRQPAAHPVYEHHRVRTFRDLLQATPSEDRRRRLGELMYQSHSSYSACGLGSPGTDLIVDLVRAQGPESGLYGARITGGGSGGTVAVIGRSDAQPAITQVVERYRQRTGYQPHVFYGSSSGVAAFGSLTVNL